MHSQFRLSNSSDELNLDVGVPGIHKIASDRNSSEFRYNLFKFQIPFMSFWETNELDSYLSRITLDPDSG